MFSSTMFHSLRQHKRLFSAVMLIASAGIMMSFIAPTTTQAQTICTQASDFMDVSTYQQTQNYPAPELSVTCTQDTMIVESNGIPNFEFVAITPNALQEQDYHWEIPLNPTLAPQTSDIPLLGPVGIAVNGLPIYGPNEAPRDDYGDPFLDGILDYCNGHTGPNGDYHFHARPECLFTDTAGNTSLVLGYSFDGFPILAPYVCTDAACTSVIEVQSSWVRTQNVANAWEAHEYVAGAGNLDECNGMTLPDGSYAYFATDSFPYLLGCYSGTASTANAVTGGGDAPQSGNGNQNTGNQQSPNGQQPLTGQQPPNGQQPPQGGGNNRPPQGGQPPQGNGNGNNRPPNG